ncbi:hypothetical protein BJV77DRAFT_971585, partial [Russula vinacea]
MRSTALTAFFFALFLYFPVAVAYAAPAAPQGATSKRQCGMPECRIVVNYITPGPTSDAAPVTSQLVCPISTIIR